MFDWVLNTSLLWKKLKRLPLKNPLPSTPNRMRIFSKSKIKSAFCFKYFCSAIKDVMTEVKMF